MPFGGIRVPRWYWLQELQPRFFGASQEHLRVKIVTFDAVQSVSTKQLSKAGIHRMVIRLSSIFNHTDDHEVTLNGDE